MDAGSTARHKSKIGATENQNRQKFKLVSGTQKKIDKK
jgi:hypothetical protein